jgi:hypothetical protein
MYSIRNFKHLRGLNATFKKMKMQSPGIMRSSMTRQQVQFHMGVGIGGFVPLFRAEHAESTHLWGILVATIVIGAVHLAHPPISEEKIQRFRSVSVLTADVLEMTESASMVTEVSDAMTESATMVSGAMTESAKMASDAMSESASLVSGAMHNLAIEIPGSPSRGHHVRTSPNHAPKPPLGPHGSR